MNNAALDLKNEWQRFLKACYKDGITEDQLVQIERAFHGGILVGVKMRLEHSNLQMMEALNEWRHSSTAVVGPEAGN